MTAHQARDDARESAAAPQIEKAWTDAFVLELRLLGVSGSRIGEALAEVEAHCAEGGEAAEVAFGHPVAYARSLARRDDDAADVARAVAPTALQVVGLLVAVWTTPALRDGTPVALTTGQLATGALLLAAIGSLVLGANAVLRAVVARPVLVALGFVALTGAMVGLLVLLDDVVLTVGAAPLAWLGLAALSGGTGWHLLARRTGRALADDPVTTPFGQLVHPPSRSSRAVDALTPWLVPAAAAVSVGLTLTLGG